MDKTIAITVGSVAVAGIGVFAYLKLRNPNVANSNASSQTNTASQAPAPQDPNAGLLITQAQKEQELIKLQGLKRPDELNNVQAVSYAIQNPKALESLKIETLLRQGGMGRIILKGLYEKDVLIQASKAYWKNTGRPKGDEVKIISNKDQTPTTLNDDQAIIYLASYPDVRKEFGFSLDKAKTHWVQKGIASGRKIDLY